MEPTDPSVRSRIGPEGEPDRGLHLLFAHDHVFFRHQGRVYSKAQFESATWNRYLEVFDTIKVLGRHGNLSDDFRQDDFELSSAPRVTFSLQPSLSSVRAQLFKRFSVRAEVAQLVRESDAVIGRIPSELGLLAASEARRAGKPWAIEVVGCGWDALRHYGSWQGPLYAPVMMQRMRHAVARAPFALYVTERFLQGRYPNRGGRTVACSNVVIPEPDPAVRERRLARIGKEDGPFVFGLIGSLKTRYKGIQTVLRALRQVRDRLPAVEFRVLGAGDAAPWRREAQQLGVADLVRFDAPLPGGQPVYDWLDEVDVYLQPSLHEGLPRALIEAMHRGCPALGSRCAGIPELLDDRCLVRPGDHRALAGLMLEASADAGWRRHAATRNWEAARPYAAGRLAEKRRRFWQAFADRVRVSG